MKTNYYLLLLFLLSVLVKLYVAHEFDVLGEWDERYHALVAKNMMIHPFSPMLRVNPIVAYDYTAWCCNHIWLHKQPLFLWQMALSMKIFGVNLLALRLPSILMSSLLIFPIFLTAKRIFNERTGIIAATLTAANFYLLGLSTGMIGMDHNDVAFVFYISCSIYFFVRYLDHPSLQLAALVGVTAGLAVLCKWLAGLLVFSGFGILILLQLAEAKKYLWHGFVALIVALIVFLPWQIYTFTYFPLESNYEMTYNAQHIWKSIEDHTQPIWYYLDKFPMHFSEWTIPFLVLGLYFGFKGLYHRVSFYSLVAFLVIPYLFFSLISQTRLPAYSFITFLPVIILISLGLEKSIYQVIDFKSKINSFVLLPILFPLCLKIDVIKNRLFGDYSLLAETTNNIEARRHNTHIYKQLNQKVPADYVLWNCKEFEDVDAMFYSDRNVYHWWITEPQFNELKLKGQKMAFINSFGNQPLPDFIKNDTKVLIIDLDLR